MPIPTPTPGQSKSEFLEACMLNDTMAAEYPDPDQRYAVCQAQWTDRSSWVLHERNVSE